MTGFSRTVAFILGLVVLACSFLPWVFSLNSWSIGLRQLLDPGVGNGSRPVSAMGAGVALASLLMVLGALLNSRATLIVGSLVALGIPAIWILGNAINSSKGIHIASIEIGAYGTALCGLIGLVLAAVASDSTEQHVR